MRSMDALPTNQRSTTVAGAAVSGRSCIQHMHGCKQKQYHNVLSSLQFVHALLRHVLSDCSSAHPRDHKIAVSTGDVSGAEDSVCGAIAAFHAASDGAPTCLDMHGPLSSAQLLSLQHSLTDAAVRHICERAIHRHPLLSAPPLQLRLRAENVFATPTPLHVALWPTESVRHRYTGALELAHRQRSANSDHSDPLAVPGYLQEAGVHARHVFVRDGVEDVSSTEGGTTRDEAGRQAAMQWGRLIDRYTAFLPDRSHIHELENLPQEIAIGELLHETAARVRQAERAAGGGSGGSGGADGAFALDCVVDVGGGNGFLAAQAAERLQCDGVVIDPFFPAHSIDCCPRVWRDTAQRTRPAARRQRTLHRTVALFRDVRWADAVPAAPARTALVAKHLCGSGVDEVLRHLEAQSCLPRILVLAPCCYHRCALDSYIDAGFVSTLLGISDEDAFRRLTRLTDWNMSCYQRLHGTGASKKSVRYLVSCPEGIAASVGAVVNQGRVQWLQQRGYVVRLVEYVPDCVTPKNHCIVAYRV
ncbi:Methyltransferase domain/Methyltransferase TRM13 [Novymonas esmeraldas]|uniref:tRNA:m(4)X modification enzyme TRM13 n=1 Tax=Novymonas esmeraldas TaxID=1808958 RepID=A0AAW0ES19_9TRYP